MSIAFIFVRVNLGTSDQVLYDIKQIPHIQEAHVVYGKFDILAKVEASTMRELKHIVTHTIRQVPNVRSTRTLIVMNGQ